MKCPGCKADMEFEEIKNGHGQWWCECGYEANGSRIPCEGEYETNSASPLACDWEEQMDEPPTYEDLKDMDGDARYHAKVDDELEGGKDG